MALAAAACVTVSGSLAVQPPAEASIACPAPSTMHGLASTARGNGMWVSAELSYSGAETGMLRARAMNQGAWEQFTFVPQSDGTVAMQSSANGMYVSAELNYSGAAYGMLRARSSAIDAWEKFRMVPGPYGCGLLAANGRYVSAKVSNTDRTYGMLVAQATTPQQWESFQPAAPGRTDLAWNLMPTNNSNVSASCYKPSTNGVVADLTAAENNQAGTGGAMLSVPLLRSILAVSRVYPICISALESYGTGHSTGSRHYLGRAVDFAAANGASLTGRDGNSKLIIQLLAPTGWPHPVPAGSRFGQSQCGTVSLPSDVSQVSDTCSHLHIDTPN